MIQFTLLPLTLDMLTSTVTFSIGTSFICFSTSLAYQTWNIPLSSSFIGLLIDTSKGWSLSVQLVYYSSGYQYAKYPTVKEKQFVGGIYLSFLCKSIEVVAIHLHKNNLPAIS